VTIRRRLLDPGLVGVAAAFALFQACGGEDERPPPRNEYIGGVSGVGGVNGVGGANPGGAGGALGTAGNTGDAGVNVPGSPDVKVVFPADFPVLGQGPVIVPDEANQIEVRCTATASGDDGAKPLDEASVMLEMLVGNVVVGEPVRGEPSAGEYTATFALKDVASGPVSFRCSARDESPSPKTGTDTNSTFVDHGPLIDVVLPTAEDAYKVKSEVPFEFSVRPAELAPGDTQAIPTEVTLTMLDVTVTLTPNNGVYTGSANFADPAFPQNLTGRVPGVVTATNGRQPTPAISKVPVNVLLDGKGPTITITSHTKNQTVKGLITLVFEVKDAESGVVPGSIAISLNGKTPDAYDGAAPWGPAQPPLNGRYTYTFDTRAQDSDFQVSIEITARDKAGNTNDAQAESFQLWLDYMPPDIDLDPLDIREIRLGSSPYYCTALFDPLYLSPNDGEDVGDGQTFRALIWDRTNRAGSDEISFVSGVDPKSARLFFLQGDADAKLLTNKDGDPENKCDTLESGAPNIHQTDLSPVKVDGAEWLGPEVTAPPTNSNCVAKGDPLGARRICGGTPTSSDMLRAIRHSVESPIPTPAVYASGILPASGLGCSGLPLEVSNYSEHEGWLCLAVQASDGLGNVGFSRPIRVCYDDPANGPNPCADPPPLCTDGCVPPARLNLGVIRQ
jgi:hypothetical protein